ncbi:Uncharacterised protein [Bordetella pertussis]|nr:Uncharacterised protein [Bordetella pertussis]
MGSSPPPSDRPMVRRKSRRDCRRSGVGPSWMRYRPGCLLRDMKSAAHVLAASMHSSISLWASLRTMGTICSIRPSSLQTMRVSTVSKSMAPRLRRCCDSSWYSSCRWRTCGMMAPSAAAAGPPGCCSASQILVYVVRACECITAL